MVHLIITYVRKDFTLNPIRAIVELFGMVAGVAAAILLAITTPIPLMTECYTLWLIGSGALFICSVSRGSTGLAISYASYFLIDCVGLYRSLV